MKKNTKTKIHTMDNKAQKQLTPEQAINLIANITGEISLKRNEHDAVLQAISVLAKAAGLTDQPEQAEGEIN